MLKAIEVCTCIYNGGTRNTLEHHQETSSGSQTLIKELRCCENCVANIRKATIPVYASHYCITIYGNKICFVRLLFSV
jgi:hypothetical protein